MAGPGSSKQQEDPLEKLGRLIDEKVTAAFETRDRTQREKDDPWARLEGLIDRAVARHFDELARSLEAEEEEDGGGSARRPRRPSSTEDEPKLGILGL